MKGWMKYRPKGGIYGRLSFDQHLFFVLTDDCILLGCKDESSAKHRKAEVSLEILNAAITINQENTNQFEVVGNGYHALFTLDDAEEALNWMSYLQRQRSVNQGVSPLPSHVKRKTKSQSVQPVLNEHIKQISKSQHKSESGSLNGELVFDDPLSIRSVASINENPEFEWDTEVAAPLKASPSIQEETSAVFQLSQELANAKAEIEAYRQKEQSYQEVLTARDKQLFEIKDEMCSLNHSQVDIEEFKNLEGQCRSYKEQNSLLNEEILKLHQMYNKTNALAESQKRRADKLAVELRKLQRDYLAALGCCVYRPLVDPDDGARFVSPDREHHISTLKSLARTVKSINGRILGCSIPAIGSTQHVDAFSFIHSLQNEALQIQYLCNHLHEAFNVLIETDDENQKNLEKWKKSILDSSDVFEITPHLQKLVLQGVPTQYRAYLWQKLTYHYIGELRSTSEDAYKVILSQQELLKDDKNLAKYFKQISMDVPRTMPSNKEYAAQDSSYRERLQNVLRAFSIHSPNVGYCQGFNFLAGGCLIFLEEEDAFWFLIAVVEKIFPPNYYRNGLAGLLADQYVLQDIIAQQLPKLSEHLSKFPDVDLAAVTTGWFLGLFFDCLPFQTLIRVWDCFLVFGHVAVYKIAFAMFKLFEPRLLELNELSHLLHAAKNIPKLCIYPAQLIKEAFNCPFPSWEDIEEMRDHMEEQLVEKHEKKMIERRYYDQRMLLLDEDQDALYGQADDKYTFNCGAASERIILCASCGISRGSQLYEVEADYMRPLRLPVTDRVTCAYIITDDVILLGLFSGQLQAYSLSENTLQWSMSLSDVVLCITSYDVMICVGTADGKLHFLQINDPDTERVCWKKPSLLDSIELSKRATTCCCYVAEQSCLWVASGPAIYVVSIGTNETDGFFLISSCIELVSFMLHWSSYVLISVRGSSIIQLHRTDDFSSPPVLVYDVARQMTLPPLYPMMPDENDAKSPTCGRVTSMVLISEGVFWVGTAGGDVTIYMVDSNIEKSANVIEASNDEERTEDDAANQLGLRMLRTQHVAEKPIRCLIKARSQVVSCSGCYGDDGAVKVWNLEGDFTVAEPAISESSSSDIFEESMALSSRSLDADGRLHKAEGTTDAWKSSFKSATANAIKPRFRKFMNMLGK